MYGDGTTQRDYTFVSDIISGIVSVVKRQFTFEIINLGNSIPIRLARLVELIEQN